MCRVVCARRCLVRQCLRVGTSERASVVCSDPGPRVSPSASRSEFAAVIAMFRTLAALTVGVLCASAWCVLRRARGGKPKRA